MAKASKTTVDVKKTVTAQEDRITLELTNDEAETVAAVFHRIAGSPDVSPRKHTNAVSDALYNAGIRVVGSVPYTLSSGSITFAAEKTALKAGDRIRILKDEAESATVDAGDVLEVKSVGAYYVTTYHEYDRTDTWGFLLSNEGDTWERVTEPAPLKVGDRIRVLKHEAEGAVVRVGDVLTVRKFTGGSVVTNRPGYPTGNWYFAKYNEGTTWERV